MYCTLRPTGEEVKEKIEKHLTRAHAREVYFQSILP